MGRSCWSLKYAQILVLLLCSLLHVGCVTTLKPVYPTSSIDKGEATSSVRFETGQISFDEPGVPLATGRLWKRDVARFTAKQLNVLLNTPDDAPVAQTRVVLELARPASFQVGAWKEFTIEVSTQLPDGRLVRSEPQTTFIDSNFEYILQQGLLFGGPVLEVSAFVLGIYLFTGGFLSFTQFPWMCGCLLGLAFSGLVLNVAQATMQWFIGVLEERRASDLYQQALIAHAADVRAVLSGTKPAWQPPAAVPAAPGALPPADRAPAPPAAPAGMAPPPLLQQDPADSSEPQPDARPPITVPRQSAPPTAGGSEPANEDTDETWRKQDPHPSGSSSKDPINDGYGISADDTPERYRY